MRPIKILVPSGCLGSPFPQEALERGLSLRPDAIAIDAGSTDSGPHYLGTGSSKYTYGALKKDLRLLMRARDQLGIPLLVGSCGTCGTDSCVDWMAGICREIAREDGLRGNVALLYSELGVDFLKSKLRDGRITPLPPVPQVSEEVLTSCPHIVGLLGYEPYAAALDAGADIVLGGRTTDTAVLAAVALRAGLPPEHAWHAAKTAECGGLCTVKSGLGGVMITIEANGFTVEPLSADNQCTPFSVSAHMLYENSDPNILVEPGIVVDASLSRYDSVDDRVVRVTGTKAETRPYTMKLEGASPAGFRTLAFTSMSDPKLMGNLGTWLSRLREMLHARIERTLGYGPDDYLIDLRPYGWNVLDQSTSAADAPPPREIGLMVLVSADTQQKATDIAKTCNPALLHFPMEQSAPVPSWAFPFSPIEVEMGPYYKFCLNHVVGLDDPMQAVRTQFFEL